MIQLLDDLAILSRGSRELARIDGRTPEGMVGHRPVGILEVDPVRVQRGTECAARVSRSRRDEHALEAGLREDAGVRHAVQGHTSAEAQIRQPGVLVQRPRDVYQRFLEHLLHAGSAVGEALSVFGREVDRFVRAARPAEEIDES